MCKRIFLIGGKEVGEIIPFPVWIILFPVWIIPFPVLKINYELLGENERHLVKKKFFDQRSGSG